MGGLGPPSLILPWLVAIAMAAVPAKLDWDYREVPESFWVTGSKVGLAVSLAAYSGFYPIRSLAVFYGLSLLGAGSVGLASLLGLMGEGDFWAVLAIALTLPAPPPGGIIPPIYLVLLIASGAELVARAVIAKRVCGSLACVRGAEVSCSALVGGLRWWFPSGTDVTSAVPSEASVRACQGGREKVRAEPGLPYVTFILLALPVSLALEVVLRVA